MQVKLSITLNRQGGIMDRSERIDIKYLELWTQLSIEANLYSSKSLAPGTSWKLYWGGALKPHCFP